MKILNTIFVLAIMAVTITSCKNTERERVDTSVDSYTDYIDSVSGIALEDASQKWNEIESSASDRKNKAEKEIQTLTSKNLYEQKIEKSAKKYDAFKKNVLTEKQKIDVMRAKQSVRNSLFKDTNIGSDLSFKWVNKGNILSVYDYFVTTAIDNKETYSKEEWEEIKMLYEALDARKNIVEKEGLTTADNLKIAELKIRFAPMYKINKFQAESEENK